jgi:hypothetical protein
MRQAAGRVIHSFLLENEAIMQDRGLYEVGAA